MEKTEKRNILFTTERLDREELNIKFVDDIFNALTENVVRYLRIPLPKTIDPEVEWIEGVEKNKHLWEQVNYVVTDKNGEFVGTCSLMDLHTRAPEVGLWIKESARGKGLWTEMVKKLIDIRNELNSDFDYLLYRAHVDNTGTRKIVERLWGVLQVDEQGNEKRFTERKFDKSASFQAVEYRIYPKK